MKSMMLCCARGSDFTIFGQARPGRLFAEIGRQLLVELARIDERVIRRDRIDEEVERIDDRHVGQQIDRDAELGGTLGKHEPRQPIAVRVLLPVHEVLGRRDLQRIAADRGAGVRRRPQPNDLRPERNRAVIPIPGDMLETEQEST